MQAFCRYLPSMRPLPGFRTSRGFPQWREHLRDTLWFAPTAGLIVTFVLWDIARLGDAELAKILADAGTGVRDFTDDAKTIVTTVSQAILTFLGVVFSISLVALQMTSGQLTPRVVRIFVRSRITKATLTVFLSTFMFSLLVLSSYNDPLIEERTAPVPLLQSLLTLALVGLSLLLFIAYVTSTVRLMQVGPVVDHITREALHALDRLPAPAGAPPQLPEQTGLIAYQGRPGVLRAVDVKRLVRCARQHGVVLRTIPRVGDYLLPGIPLLAVHGGRGAPPATVGHVTWVGSERSALQDRGFALRQLADIALRALSAAVNDPTTAVQCLDHIVHLLATLVTQRLGPVAHHDRAGQVRLVQAAPRWPEVVDVGIAELRAAAVGQAQVTRRLLAGINDLLALVPEGRREPLLGHKTLLERAVHQAHGDHAERAFALQPDRQGIG
ncbi:DUF2254 domain-containing protein [Streptomyces sp. NPDC016562]|uniref:DUF2254 domain-containing protein n=1 Tax=Streptomyces sp. NPDC016562 TaxID=3364966 RepID=UPI003701EAB3